MNSTAHGTRPKSSRATVTGSLNRRRPALPGLTNNTPPRSRSRRLVRMPGHHHAEPGRRRVEIQFVHVMQDVDECAANLGNGCRGQRGRPSAGVHIPPHCYYRRNGPQRVQNLGSTHVTRVDDQVRAGQRAHCLRPQQAMRIRDQPDYRHRERGLRHT